MGVRFDQSLQQGNRFADKVTSFTLRFKQDGFHLCKSDIEPIAWVDGKEEKNLRYMREKDAHDARWAFERWFVDRGLEPPEIEIIAHGLGGSEVYII